MIPIDNSIAGRVADIHHLLPHSKIFIIGERFEEIKHHLLGLPGAKLRDIKKVYSHPHALNQCRKFIHANKIRAITEADTASAAYEVAQLGIPSNAAIASSPAGEIYGLEILRKNIADTDNNITRFVIIAKKPAEPKKKIFIITSFIFRVRSVPAALYKAIGGFATNGVNILKLESYIVDPKFTIAQFYIEIEGGPSDYRIRLSLEELRFFSEDVRILGTYPAHPFRHQTTK